MRTTPWVLGLLALTACSSPFRRGKGEYGEGMYWLRNNPPHAGEHFRSAERHLADALEEGGLDAGEMVTAVTLRARALVELERYEEASELVSGRLVAYHPDKRYVSDRVGLAAVRARALDPERGLAELVMAAAHALTPKSRLFLEREQVLALIKLGTPKARAQAAKICEANAGKLDFDQLRK
jgi:hypothetical protein